VYLKKRYKLIGLIMLLAAFSGACRTETVRHDDGRELRTFTDDLGREVRLPLRLERVVSLAPSLTEMIFAAGAGERLVGVTTYCNFPVAAQAIQKVSDTQTPNIESIVALQPQVVFVSTASQLESFMRMLDERNIAVFVTKPAQLDDVFRHLNQFGQMFGTVGTTDEAIGKLQGRVAAVQQKTAGIEPKSVFVQISKEPLFTIGRDSFLTEVITLAGGRSATADIPSGYPKLSKETALALDPEVIILSDSDDNKEPNDVFKSSPAMMNGRVYRIDADLISRPGPRIVDAMELIAGHLSSNGPTDR